MHVHFPKKTASIQDDLNDFLLKQDYSKKKVTLILSTISKYVDYYSHKAAKLLKQSINEINSEQITNALVHFHHAINEINYEKELISQSYLDDFRDDFHCIKCLPLCVFVIDDIEKHLVGNFE